MFNFYVLIFCYCQNRAEKWQKCAIRRRIMQLNLDKTKKINL